MFIKYNYKLPFFIIRRTKRRGYHTGDKNIIDTHNISYSVIKKGLNEYITIISIAQLMICNDSGAAHIASAFGVPTVVIFGNVDPKYVTPLVVSNLRIISHNLECNPAF